MPASLTIIGTSAFTQDYALTSLDLSKAKSLTTIGNSAFYECTGLIGALITPTSLETIGEGAFEKCSGLTGLQFSSAMFEWAFSLETIGEAAFRNCTGLVGEVYIPSCVTTIGNRAFFGDTGLRSFRISTATITTMGYEVFSGCSGLEYIYLSATLPSLASLSRASSSTAGYMFSSLPAHTVVYLPSSTPVAPDASTPNYVQGGVCPWFYVQDGCDYYLPYAFTAERATWGVAGTGAETTPNATRAVSGYATAYLPYPFTPSGVKAYMLDYKNNHKPDVNTDNTFVFTQVTSVAANTPFVVSGSGAFPEASGVSVPKTPIGRVEYDAAGVASYNGVTAIQNTNGGTPIDDPNGGTWGIYGSTEAIPTNLWSTWNVYALGGDGKWYQYDKSATVAQFRAFIVGNGTPATAKPNITFVDLDGTTNGIGGVDNDNSVETRIYNLNGQYLGKDINSLPKGMYIVNGKKVIK